MYQWIGPAGIDIIHQPLVFGLVYPDIPPECLEEVGCRSLYVVEKEFELLEKFFFSEKVREHLIDLVFNRRGLGYDANSEVDIIDVLSKFFMVSISRGLKCAKNRELNRKLDMQCLELVESLDKPEVVLGNLRMASPIALSSLDIANIMLGKAPFLEKLESN